LGPNGTRFARAVSGPKKSRFLGHTLSNAPHNDVAPLKIITYRAIKTTGTLIVIKNCKKIILWSPHLQKLCSMFIKGAKD
jgi:hypothetical protein